MLKILQSIDFKKATQQGDIPVRIIKKNKFTFSKVLPEMFNVYIDSNTFPNGLNDTHREKLFYSVQDKNGCLAASDLFHMFTQSVKFYTFYYYVLKSSDV